MIRKVGMNCTAVYRKSLCVALDILKSVYTDFVLDHISECLSATQSQSRCAVRWLKLSGTSNTLVIIKSDILSCQLVWFLR